MSELISHVYEEPTMHQKDLSEFMCLNVLPFITDLAIVLSQCCGYDVIVDLQSVLQNSPSLLMKVWC